MQLDAVYARLNDIFREIFMRDDLLLQPQLSAKDVDGWDSFKMIEIIMATEERFGITLSVKDVDELKCVGDLAQVVARKSEK